MEKEIAVERERNCDACDGSGSEAGHSAETCRKCGGSGNVRVSQGFFSMATTCPACRGQRQGHRPPLQKMPRPRPAARSQEDQGDLPGRDRRGQPPARRRRRRRAAGRAARPGDLYIVVRIKPDKQFQRHGHDLLFLLPISFSQAALGDEVTIQTFEGAEKIKIPPVDPERPDPEDQEQGVPPGQPLEPRRPAGPGPGRRRRATSRARKPSCSKNCANSRRARDSRSSDTDLVN